MKTSIIETVRKEGLNYFCDRIKISHIPLMSNQYFNNEHITLCPTQEHPGSL